MQARVGWSPRAEIDWLMAAVIALCCFGLLMAVSIHGPQPDVGVAKALQDQGTKLFVGVAVFLVAVMLPLSWYRAAAKPLLFGSIAACGAALLFDDVNGARRWIRIGAQSFQPVELARFGLILYAASWIADRGDDVRRFRSGFVALMGPAVVLALILIAQPDVGNAMFALAIAAVMALVGGVRLWHFLLIGLPLAVPVLMWVLTHAHVRDRLTGFLEVQAGSQVWQGLVAIASGGLLGNGVGGGWMKMGFVPEAGNDFVFAVLGEELGLVGGVIVVALYAVVGAVGLRLFLRLTDPFHRLVVLGFSFAICMQAAINMLVVTGMAPAKGIDLPFLSSGGTNLVFSLAAIGIIGNAARSDSEVGAASWED